MDDDLQLLRAFRADEAEPPIGLQARIEEQLWQAILAEEAQRAGSARTGAHARRRWFQGLLRPAVAAGAAATIAAVVAFSSDGGVGVQAGPTAVARQAGVLDSTATALFGDSVARTTTGGPISGAIDLSSRDEHDVALLRGPRVTSSGELDADTAAVVRETTRDSIQLQARLRAIASEAAGGDRTDRVAFDIAMQWVTAPEVPVDLRAAMLRSLDGMAGLDAALVGADVLGRQGVVLGHLDAATGVRTQYVLDPEGATLLERRAFTVGYVDPACPPGTFTQHELYDEDGEAVLPAEAPWLDWPIVVDACEPALAAG